VLKQGMGTYVSVIIMTRFACESASIVLIFLQNTYVFYYTENESFTEGPASGTVKFLDTNFSNFTDTV